MPSDERCGLDHLQIRAPVAGQFANHYPKQAVDVLDTRTFFLSFIDVQLLLLEKDDYQQPEDGFKIIAMHCSS